MKNLVYWLEIFTEDDRIIDANICDPDAYLETLDDDRLMHLIDRAKLELICREPSKEMIGLSVPSEVRGGE
jgi:hypothetical protein